MQEQVVDVCVIGAGVGGAACAQGLARQGRSVVLLERLDPMPDTLKAEKIDGAAVQALLRRGFAPAVEAAMTPLHSVGVFLGERALGTHLLDPPEAGAFYHVIINSLRRYLDPGVDFRPGVKATGFEQRPDGISVVTATGERIACRLVVMASGDARHLLESLGGVYEPVPTEQVYAVAFTMDGQLGAAGAPVDSETYQQPVAGSPIAYATIFRLGGHIRANVYVPGQVGEQWERDLKQRPLEALVAHNRTLAVHSRTWRVISPVITRKVHVAQLHAPALPRLVVLGDAAHTIDPGGGGGMLFALLEVELLLDFYIPRWLTVEAPDPAAIKQFYDDPRRMAAVEYYFGRGTYIQALSCDTSLRGHMRRLRFAGASIMDARRRPPLAAQPSPSAPAPTIWQPPAHPLYDQYVSGQ